MGPTSVQFGHHALILPIWDPFAHACWVDLVNGDVYTKFGLNRSNRFLDIEQKLNSDVNQGP